MKVYKAERFKASEELTNFLNQKRLPKEDIVFITKTDYWFHLFYYEEE